MDINNWIYRPDDGFPELPLIGGKCFHLASLGHLNLPIPAWMSVTTAAFEQLAFPLIKNGVPPGQAIQSIEFPVPFVDDLMMVLADLKMTDTLLAVRSSAVDEDHSSFSHAGQLSSFLCVKPDQVLKRIKDVWASAFSKHALDYIRNTGRREIDIRVAVLIQKMVRSDYSGVAFSIDPVNGDRQQILVGAVYGLGESLVSGHADGDTYRIKDQKVIHKELRPQYTQLKWSPDGQVTETSVPDSLVGQPVLTDQQCLDIAALAVRCSSELGTFQDIEWAIESGNLYLLQSRPISTLSQLADQTQETTIWDNSNIVESYPGVTSPLTFSFISDIYREVYKEFCRILGVSNQDIKANEQIFSMLGFIEGRVYYDLKNWYHVLALLPGYDINARFMETMMGVKEPFTGKLNLVPSSENKLKRVIRLILGLIWRHWKLPGTTDRFYHRLRHILAPYEGKKLQTMDVMALRRAYSGLENGLITRWDAPLVNDFFAMVFYGVLKQLLVKWEIDKSGSLQNQLLAGEGDIITTKSVRAIQALVNEICEKPAWSDCFETDDPRQVWKNIQRTGDLHLKVMEYVGTYGIRWVGELKLETITPYQDPVVLMPLLQSFVRQGKTDIESAGKTEKQVRSRAERDLRLKVGGFRKIILFWVLKQARERIKNRENLRFERTRLFSVIRELFLTMGMRLQQEQVIDHHRDIFFLTKEEVFKFLDGTGVDKDLRPLIEKRKTEQTRFLKSDLPERFTTYGGLYLGNRFESMKNTEPLNEDLSGIGCCAGVIRAPVKIVEDPSDVTGLKDHILIAERTDPGWTPLFPLAKGIVVERGSLLSHSAIVAREMGIPAIVSVNGLLKKLNDGDWIEMDGTTGRIVRIEPKDAG